MPPAIQVAGIQMDGAPAPIAERLKRAEILIQDAISNGAELVVLPAVFNTGKTFLETNYEVTEQLSGTTMQWMCEQAEKHQIHIAGSWMVVDKDDSYHSAFIVAPDGKSWRYDAQYPFLWERVFYRNGHGITVADTALGKIGLMIGWDVTHPEIWERYAAKVDILLILSDTLDVKQVSLQHEGVAKIQRHQFGFFAKWLANASANYLHDDIEEQSRWMNVPIVCAGASGEFSSILPAPFFSIQGLLFGQPGLWNQVDKHYAEMQLVAPFQENTRILDSNGDTLVQALDEGDAVIFSEIELADKTPLPLDEQQPEMTVSEQARIVIDLISGGLFTLTYRRGVRRQWGARMAPMDANTAIWLRILIVTVALTALLSRLSFRKRR